MKHLVSISLFVVLLLNTLAATAQTDKQIAIKLGENTSPVLIKNGAKYEISLTQLKEDSEIHIYSKEGKYTITEYQLAYISKTKFLAGPYEIKGMDLVAAIAKNDLNIARGSSLYIDELKAVCKDCSNNKEISGVSMTIKIQ